MKMSFNYGHPPLPLNPPPPPPPMQMPILSQQGHNQMMTGQMMMGAMIGPQGFHQGMMGSLINPDHMGNSPGMNDAPLEFNTNKNKPPMPISSEELESEQRKAERNRERLKAEKEREIEEERKLKEIQRKRDRDRNRDRGRDRRDREKERDRRDERDHKGSSSSSNGKSSPGSRSPQPPEASVGTAGQGGQGPAMWGGIMAPPMPPMGPYPVMGMNPMMMDPSVMIGQYNMMGMGMGGDGAMLAGDQGPPSLPMAKEVIQFKEFSLFPPSPNAPPPTTRERPPGCKTIFVGGLPENATEEMIRELFGRCGEMLTVRLNNKKFCHIRFLHEASVDAALYFSGYRMRIGSNTDAPNTGRLHVDYAQARDDQYEWECRQRQAQREQRHRDRVEKERLRVPSPPPVQHYTDHEANLVAEKIKSDDDFTKAVQVVITWLERGDCSKRNANTFYSMIQSTNSHVRRLLTEKATYEEELTRAKELMKGRMQGLLIQFSQIERVFSAASHKKVWDHFTKPQRKNIEMWKKQASEIKSVELEDNLLAGGDEEMEVSDTDDEFNAGSVRKKQRKEDTTFLKEENDSLRCQLEAYKNEVDLVKSDLKMELEQKEKQLKVCQQTLQGMQQQLLDAKRKQGEDELKALDLQAKLKAKQEREKKEGDGNDREEEINEVDTTESLLMLSSKLSEKEAKLIGLISIFLHVHPFGAGVDYIWSYLQKLDPSLRTSDVEALMSRFPAMFQQELSGIGANMERRWVYAGFHTD